jgi:GT2 family glycosyltransferase
VVLHKNTLQLPDITIIIVNFRGWTKLSLCLHSLNVIEDDRFSHEVIIIDNHSDDGMITGFQQLYPKFKFIVNSGNNGFANGCNLGAMNSLSPFLLFLNPDTVVSGDAIFAMLSELRIRRAFSIVSCRQVKSDGSEERPYGKYLSPFNLTGWLRALNKMAFWRGKEVFIQTADYIYPDWVSGSVVMMNRENFHALGGWDENFWMYFEDVDLCRRARHVKGEIVLLKSVNVEHNHGGSSRINKKVTAITKAEVNISRHIYISKHETGLRAVYMHLFLIVNNLILGFLPAIAGTVFFFIKSLNTLSLTYFQLLLSYFNVLKKGTWVSKRALNFVKISSQ